MPRVHQSTGLPWPSPFMISGARYSWVPTKEFDRALVGSTISCGIGLLWAARSDFSFLVLDSSLGVKHGTCHAGWRQNGSMHLESVHGLETLFGDLMGGEDFSSVGVAAHLSDKSKSVSMMWPSSRTKTFSGFKSRYTTPSMWRYSSARRTSAI